MYLKKIKIFGFFCLFSLFTSFLLAQEFIIDFEGQKKFADQLFSKKEFYRAITEYHKLLHFFPQTEKLKIHTQIIKSYLAGLDYTGAIDYVEKLKFQHPSLFQNNDIKFLYALALLEKDKQRIFFYRQDNIEKAIRTMQTISPNFEKPVGKFLETWEISKKTIPQKSPWLAGSLSAIFPGAGSIYNERYTEALYSFFITSLFFFSSIEAAQNNKTIQEAVFSFFALAFYGGNIYTAINGAYKYNEYEKSNTLTELQIKYNIQF